MQNNKEMIPGATHEERTKYQLGEWVKGNSIHNEVDEECCPDFSCCNKDMQTPQYEKDQFIRMTNAGHSTMQLLGAFLSRAMDLYYQKKGKRNEVHIITGEQPEDN